MYQKNRNDRRCFTPHRDALVLVVMSILLMSFRPTVVARSVPATEEAPTAPQPPVASMRILQEVAESLGWPATPVLCDGQPGHALRVSASGAAGDATWAMVSLMERADEPTLLDLLESQGMTRGLFHGREAIIVRRGDRLPNGYAPSLRGLIAWRCGPYVLAAEDATGSGREQQVAETLYAAAEQCSLCGIAGSVVVLAEADDAPGKRPLAHFRALAQAADDYYKLNGYGRVTFDFAFMDADGPEADHDWYNLGPSFSAYEDAYELACAALRRAFASTDLPEVVYLERAIVVYAQPADTQTAARLWAQAIALRPDHAIEVAGPAHTTQVVVTNLVLIPEEQKLGIWVHELGHTLHADAEVPGGFERIQDRYSDAEAGEDEEQNGFWDLMGHGEWWGITLGTAPTHMSSYTKVAAGWLRYAPAALGQDYVLTALENQAIGAEVLRLPDPASADPRCYYIIEARDGDVRFGAPGSGVVIYHVSYDAEDGHPLVEALSSQDGEATGSRNGRIYQRATLHGTADPKGTSEYVNAAGGFKVTLLAESFSPYRATVRIERFTAK